LVGQLDVGVRVNEQWIAVVFLMVHLMWAPKSRMSAVFAR
jgi:hypothetical protein